ncbi:retrovirus-related Pol polyprotein from transposon 297 [Trichonephila clavipes]|nr:retrovirus-related Pol polyprotein from transposon 297 [Trichonephila clavipes]
MSSGRSLPQINLGVQGGIQWDSHSGAQRNINPEIIDRIGGIPELKPDTTTITDRRWNPTDLEGKVMVIIVGLIVDAEVVNLIRFNNHGGRQGGSRNGAFRDKPGLTPVLYHEIDTGDQGPVVSRPYLYDRVKQGIIDYHIQKMLKEGTIRPIQSPYVSPVVLTRKNNDLPPDSPEAYRFAIDYRKLNAITKYPRSLLPLIDDLITNILFTTIMSTLDLKSGYFQLAINSRDIENTAFITRNGTFAFNRMPFSLSGVTTNFQKAIDMILKPVLGRFVSCYMDDVIITSPSFTKPVDHLNQVFTLLRDAGIHKIIHEELHKKKVVCRWVSCNLTDHQKENHTRIRKETLKLLNDGGQSIISKIITGEETYISFFDIPKRQESKVWVFKDDTTPTMMKRQLSMKK